MSEKTINNNLTKLESLIELAQILGQQSDYEEVLRLIVEKASKLVNSDSALVMMINPKTRNTIKTIFAESSSGYEQNHFVHTNICGWVILNNSSLLSADIKSDNRFRKRLFEKINAKSAICVPFRVENIIIGTLLLLNNESKHFFSESDLSLIEKYASIASPFLHCTQDIAEYFISPMPKKVLLGKYGILGLLGKSEKFVELLQSIDAATRCDVRILLEGESGTGKELVARAVHQLSPRGDNKFVAIDCGAIQPNLVESELFGHIKGSFTGAAMDRKGLFEEANGGTLFMDEINNLPVDMQSKLLRVLQDEEIRPVGSNQTRKVNVRIITASSSSLQKLINENKLREDLYYRLNVYPIHVPSLKDRIEDIPLLAEHFLKRFSSEQKKTINGFHEEVTDYLKQRHWTGNVRELEYFIQRLVTLTTKNHKIIDRKILPSEFQKELKKLKKEFQEIEIIKPLSESLIEYEEEVIRTVLKNCKWNQSKAARMLNISEHDIRYKIKKLKIKKPN